MFLSGGTACVDKVTKQILTLDSDIWKHQQCLV